jgi:hypothetical protein
MTAQTCSLPAIVVFLPLAGSVIFKLLARAMDLQDDSPLGVSWVGSLELAGLLLGGIVASAIVFARRRVTG